MTIRYTHKQWTIEINDQKKMTNQNKFNKNNGH